MDASERMSWATISRSRGPRSRAAATARLTTVGLSAFEPMRFMAGRWRFGGDLAVVAWESDGQLVVSTAGDSSIAPSRVGAAWTGRTRSSRKESSTSSRTPCVKNSRMRPSQSRLKSPFVNPNPNAEAMAQRRSNLQQEISSRIRRMPSRTSGDRCAGVCGPEELCLSARATLQRAF